MDTLNLAKAIVYIYIYIKCRDFYFYFNFIFFPKKEKWSTDPQKGSEEKEACDRDRSGLRTKPFKIRPFSINLEASEVVP